MNNEVVNITDVVVDERIRRDSGDIISLARSIKEFGIIQPIVLSLDTSSGTRLVAGGRRLAAIKSLGITSLEHGKHFVWRGEEDAYQRKAVELEENLRRQDLSWSEVVLAKKQLLDLMVAKHGEARIGPPTRAERADPTSAGFGVRKLAEMLGESASTTSNDLQVAQMITKFPSLKALPSKKDALRRLNVAVTIVGMQSSQPKVSTGTQNPGEIERPWVLYHGDFRASAHLVDSSSVDLIATDLPYACGLGDGTAAHSAGLGKFADSNIDIDALCRDVAVESFRVLKNDRFAVFFFGFAYYEELTHALRFVGFDIDPYPFIWHRDRTAPPSPARYAKSYDPAIICFKGSPTLLRPNLGNYIDIASVRGEDRLHSAQKPVQVMERFIGDMVAPGGTVVDWMAGSGTTGVAALKLRCKAIMFELEKANCSIIEARMGAIK